MPIPALENAKPTTTATSALSDARQNSVLSVARANAVETLLCRPRAQSREGCASRRRACPCRLGGDQTSWLLLLHAQRRPQKLLHFLAGIEDSTHDRAHPCRSDFG